MEHIQTELEQIARQRIRRAVTSQPLADCQTIPLDTLAEAAALEPSLVAELVVQMDLAVQITGTTTTVTDANYQEVDA